MCGIAGFSLSVTDNQHVNSRKLAKNLLLGIEARGKDATGFAFIDAVGDIQVHKADQDATKFVSRRLALPKRATAAVLHTRFATKGEPEVNANNHPIRQGTLVGVHNGWLTNDEQLWKDTLDPALRKAEVDSEAIFALLAHGTRDGLAANVLDALELVKGNAAVAWLDTETPDTLYLARGHSSPLWIGQTSNESIVFASEASFVTNACEAAGLELTHLREAVEGTVFTVIDGEVTRVQNFKPQGPGYTSRSAYIYDSWDDGYDYGAHKTAQQSFQAPFKSAKDAADVFLAQADGTVAIIGDDDQADFWSPLWMSKQYFDSAVDVPFANEAAYQEAYSHREEAITDWFDTWKGEANRREQALENMGAYVRPGDLVTTRIGENGSIVAQVIECPFTFPQGRFLLRAEVPKPGQGAFSKDVVLIQRHFSEFAPINPTHLQAERLAVVV